MALLVKGEVMPKTCGDCLLEFYFYSHGWCQLLDDKSTDYVRETGRLDDCPLIEVYEPDGEEVNA